MRALTMDEVEFVSGGFGLMADTQIIGFGDFHEDSGFSFNQFRAVPQICESKGFPNQA
jgi:hypothetical protein